MEKRVVLAFGLSILVFMAWSYFFTPPPPTPDPTTGTATESTQNPGSSGDTSTSESTNPDPYSTNLDEASDAASDTSELGSESDPTLDALDPTYPKTMATNESQETIETDLVQVMFSTRGAGVVSWQLKNYANPEGQPVDLIPRFDSPGKAFPLAVELDDASLAKVFNEAIWEYSKAGNTVTFKFADGRGLEGTKAFTFDDNSYLIDVTLDLRDRGRRLPARLVWGPSFGVQDTKDRSNFYYQGRAAFNIDGEVDRTKRSKVTESRLGGNLIWGGIEDQYFAALFIPQSELAVASTSAEELTPILYGNEQAEADAKAKNQSYVAVQITDGQGQLFVGPKNYNMLQDYGYELDKSVAFSRFPLLYVIAKFLYKCLMWIHDHTIANYGIAIILTTFILRLVLFPLNQWSMMSIRKSQAQMARIQPKINALRKKYAKKKDMESRGQMNQQLMELYKKEGVNPMGGVMGCLPMLAQFPILIGFYNMLTVAVELRGAPFYGWIQDLSVKDPYWITPLLMGVTMFVQQKLAMNKVTDPQMKQQQKIMMFMPFFFTWICLQMPSGLVLYWFVNNILGIGQQWLVNRNTDRLEPAVQKS